MGSASSSLEKCNSSPCALLSTTISGGLDVPPELIAMADKRVRVHNATHYRNRVRDVFHDFIVLEATLIVVVGHNSDLKFMIRAEKYKNPAQIKVSRPLLLEDDGMIIKYGPAEIGEEILMNDLLKILTEESADYNLLSNNCWSYADSTFKKLIKKLTDSNPEKRERLRQYLNNPRPTMPYEAGASSSTLVLGGIGASSVGLAISLVKSAASRWGALGARIATLATQNGQIQEALAQRASLLLLPNVFERAVLSGVIGNVPISSMRTIPVLASGAVRSTVFVPSVAGFCLLVGGICCVLGGLYVAFRFIRHAMPSASRSGGIAPLPPAEGLPLM